MCESFGIRCNPPVDGAEQLRDPPLAHVLGSYLYQTVANFRLNEEPPVSSGDGEADTDEWSALTESRVPHRRETSEERLHQTRVALRRVRSTLTSCQQAYDTSWREELEDELNWYGAILGAARDLDVMKGHLSSIVGSPKFYGVRDCIEERVNLDITAAIEVRRVAQCDPRYRRIVDALAPMPRNVPFTEFATHSAQLELARCLKRRWYRVERAGKRTVAHPSMKLFHRLRIELKRTQYALTVMEMGGGADVEDFSLNVNRLQSRLGTAHDLFVAQRWVANLMSSEGDDRKAFTVLSQECHTRRVAALKHWSREMRTLKETWGALESQL